MKYDKQYLYNAYNATSTGDENGEIETYENWLERQLLSRIERLDKLEQVNGDNAKKSSCNIPHVKHFKFFSSHAPNELIKELDTDMQAPIKGNYVWLNGGVRFQVTAVHYDYEKHIIKIYCA